MKSFNINIKGKNIWKVCALLFLAVFIFCCTFTFTSIDQPTTGIAGQELPITLGINVFTNVNGGGSVVANYIVGVLMPKGWDVGNNATVSYTSSLGDGNMQEMPATEKEPESVSNGTNLTWSAAMKNKFKIGNNLVDDMEWVVFRSVQQISIPNTVTITGNINFKILAGVDGNTTIFKPAYVICESFDGLNHWNPTTPDYGYTNADKITVNGPGDLVDLCDPLLTSFDPPKSLDNDFVTLSYNSKLDTAAKLKGTNLYLCVDTALTADGKVLTNFCSQSPKSQLKQTTANSGLYKLTIWPRSYFGLTSSQTLSQIIYHIIDANGNRVGFADTDASFSYKFKCN